MFILLKYKYFKKHTMQLWYYFGYDITVRFIETWMFYASGLNGIWCKVKFLIKYLSWIGTNHIFTGCRRNFIYIAFVWNAMEIDGKVDKFKYSPAVIDGPLAMQICQRSMFDPKKEIPYWYNGDQSAEYVKYAKIYCDYFGLIFILTLDLGNPFLVILCLLKILNTHLADFMPTNTQIIRSCYVPKSFVPKWMVCFWHHCGLLSIGFVYIQHIT